MNLKAALFAMLLPVFSGCASQPMTDEEASKILSNALAFDANKSFAANLCPLAPGGKPNSCPSDAIVEKSKYDKFFLGADGNYVRSIPLARLKDAEKDGLYKTIIKGRSSVIDILERFFNTSELDDRIRFVAVIPEDKANDPEEARKYVFDGFDKAYRTLYKKLDLTERGSFDRNVLSEGKLYYYSGLIVTDKKGCDRKFQNGKLKSASCAFTSDVNNDKINEKKAIAPAWLPHGGFPAWIVTGHTRLYTTEDYKGNLNAREIAFDVASQLPEGFYLLLPIFKTGRKTEGGEDILAEPAMVLSNKEVFFYAKPDSD